MMEAKESCPASTQCHHYSHTSILANFQYFNPGQEAAVCQFHQVFIPLAFVFTSIEHGGDNFLFCSASLSVSLLLICNLASFHLVHFQPSGGVI